MIAVLADDLSGAAEIAAVGWRLGLKAQVSTAFSSSAEADLLVVDTDTRSATRTAAQARIEDLTRSLRSPAVQWIYKKVDSVLRGHVATELEVMMRTLGKRRTILAPANPSRGRTIADGRYLIGGRPLDQTDFAHDPQWPARSCLVANLLDTSEKCPVHVLKHTAYSSQTGIVMAEAKTLGDLSRWAGSLDEQTLAAGGADFFRVILEKRLPSRKAVPEEVLAPLHGPKWFVCGSASDTSRKAVAEVSRLGIPVCPMPNALFTATQCDEALIGQWARDIVSALAVHGCAIAAIGMHPEVNAQLALALRTQMSVLVRCVLDRTRIGELFIEGGATARAILDGMGWETLTVLGEYGPGVVRLSVQGPEGKVVTLKPGTYPWPKGLLEGKKGRR
jgi:uncharacterized protein YgbK (DUF1537 family)